MLAGRSSGFTLPSSQAETAPWGWGSAPEQDLRVPVLRGRESRRIANARCVFPSIFETPQGGGFERAFVEVVLEKSAEVEAWFKPLERRHSLCIPYRTRFGELSCYWPDFLVKTKDAMWLIETKAARDRDLPSIWDKARASMDWCRTASQVAPPMAHPGGASWAQAQLWKYAILFDDRWDRKPSPFALLADQAEQETLAFLRGHGWVEAGSLLSLMQD